MPADVSTVVLIDERGAHKKSAAILRTLPHLGQPFVLLYPLLLCIPSCVRDAGYDAFARNRGSIWKGVKRATGMGDTLLWEYRDRILGVDGASEPLLAKYALQQDATYVTSRWLGFKARCITWAALGVVGGPLALLARRAAC
mmetsp:Transcript_60929/g.122151  ORF Transcript_60929/g.122151 Transcript_60929/m.122151 type:complete len:142 (-) Transcript_60929:302-727(-)